jgi:hypothetical protein
VPQSEYKGLIQHSFALQVPPELRPVYTRRGVTNPEALLRALFETSDYELGDAGMTAPAPGAEGAWEYSLLADRGQTKIKPLRLPFKEPYVPHDLTTLPDAPTPFGWAGANKGDEIWDGFVFGDDGRERPASKRNDFLVECREAPRGRLGENELEASRFLAQLLANKRSHLFGLALGRNSFNILTPHATLVPEATSIDGLPRGEWLVQPLLSLFYVLARSAFRPTFSFSLFLIPVERPPGIDGKVSDRPMPVQELRDVIKTQWPLATAFGNPENRPTFTVGGPLVRYLEQAAASSVEALGIGPEGGRFTRLTLREFTEATLFSLANVMAAGSRARPGTRSRKLLGDRIVHSLSASRVTMVAVVDDRERDPDDEERETRDLEESLADLAKKIAYPIKSEEKKLLKEYRLDEPLFDRQGYASAVVPDDRCLIIIGAERVQKGLHTSLLLEVGWTAFQVIGTATATGLIRSIFREITVSERAEPNVIADIEGEAMVELHETYDIEIIVEAHRRHNCLLREYLGIEKEYEALSEKLQALHRETATRADGRSETRLAILTWAIVVLSALILVGTLALILKPGG